MKTIRISPSPSTSAPPADSAAPGASQSGEDFGPILQAASARGAPAPGKGAPQAARSQQRQTGSTTSGGDAAGAAREAAAAPPSRRSESDSQNGTDAAAATAVAAHAVTPGHGAADPTSLDGANAAIAAVTPLAADATAAGLAIEAAGAAASHSGVSAGTVAPGAASTHAVEAAPSAAAGAAMRALAPPTGARAATQAVLVRGDDVAMQSAGGPPRTGRIAPEQAGTSAIETSAASLDANATDDADASSVSLGAALPLSAAALREGIQAAAQAAANALAAPGAKATDGAATHAASGAVTLAPSDTSGAIAAPTGSTAASTPTYRQDGRAHVATPVDQPEFGQELSQRVVLLTRGGVQTAQISLQPPDLGPVGVSIQLHGHQAALTFTAAHEATRNALEAALPRLREAFAASGLQLSDATVGGRSQSAWDAPARPQGAAWQNGDGAVGADPVAPSESAHGGGTATVRLVDIYA
jgi:flagellar hook-length control protein FliK